MTILIETRLALLLLGGNVVGDEGVVALLGEGVLALHLVLVHRRLHLHHLVDAPEVVTLIILTKVKDRTYHVCVTSFTDQRSAAWGSVEAGWRTCWPQDPH